MKTIRLAILAAAALAAVGAPSLASETLIVGATAVPHAEILEFVKPIVAKEGVDLDIRVFSDYVQPNAQLVSGELDANYFQYRPYLIDFNRQQGASLVPIVPVHIEPFVAYSTKIDSLDKLPDGAKVATPNDPVTALKDVTENPKKLDIVELESAFLPRALSEVDLGVLNGNYVFEAKLDIAKSLYIERGQDGRNIWGEYLVTRPENKDDADIAILAKALNSDATRKFIEERYHGQVFPAF